MRRSVVAATLLFLVAGTALAHGRHGSSVNVSFDDAGDVTAGCGGMSIRFGGERVPVVAEEIPFHGNSLRIRSAGNGGGIRVVGTTGSSYGLTVCKAVEPGVDPGSVRAILAGNEVTAAGPPNERWVAYFLVQMPRHAAVDVRASNGPISIRNVTGDVQAEAVNGPISVKESWGTITVSTKNGPVSLSGGGGNIKLDATNGPVSVNLTGGSWDGTLDAATKNGPVTLKLPRGFRSGVVVEAGGSSPVSCRAEGCPAERLRPWEDTRPRRIELGPGPHSVRVSTVNGPVSVKETE